MLMKKILRLTSALLLVLISKFAYSISVGDITVIMPNAKTVTAKEISNSTNTARYVSVSVVKISSPMGDGKEIPMDSKSELLSTPASLILPAGAKDAFKFIYNGPKDNVERYYRIKWLDIPISDNKETDTKKSGTATTSAEIGTILVVAPREEVFDYKYENNILYNSGNATFRAIAYGTCKDKRKDTGKGCRERYFVMPGKKLAFKHVDISSSKSRAGIWHGQDFITVK